MTDPTNQELKNYLDKKFETMDTKFKSMDARFDRLERKIAEGRAINIKHHLEIREDIGGLNKRFTAFQEGLAHAAGVA